MGYLYGISMGYSCHMYIHLWDVDDDHGVKPAIWQLWEWFIAPIYGELGDGLLVFYQHYVGYLCDMAMGCFFGCFTRWLDLYGGDIYGTV
jgi:hypothetical protein